MRVVVPYVDCAPETVAALVGTTAEFVDVSSSDERYWEVLHGLWAAAEDFALVEHDVVVRQDTLSGFAACRSVWCVAPYEYFGYSAYGGLGCVRFRAELLEAIPDALDVVGGQSVAKHPPKSWCSLDGLLQRYLEGRGQRRCFHESVKHLGDGWPKHGCVPRTAEVAGAAR